MGSDDRAATFRLRGGDLAAREVAGETIVLDLNGSVYFAVNGAGTVLWRALERGSVTQDDLVAALQGVYDVPRDRAAQDVDAFLRRCAAAGLLAD